jgi:hypothetical protein
MIEIGTQITHSKRKVKLFPKRSCFTTNNRKETLNKIKEDHLVYK